MPVGRDTVFSLMSLSKVITNVLTLRLVEDGYIRLTTPLSDWLPELSGAQAQTGLMDETDNFDRMSALSDLTVSSVVDRAPFDVFGPQAQSDASAWRDSDGLRRRHLPPEPR